MVFTPADTPAGTPADTPGPFGGLSGGAPGGLSGGAPGGLSGDASGGPEAGWAWSRWVVVGLAVAVVVSAAGLVVAWQLDVRAKAREGQARVRAGYADGHKAYLVGDCTRAQSQFDLLLAMPDVPAETATAARAQQAACTRLTAVRTLTGAVAGRLAGYLDYLAADPPAPLDGLAAQEVERTLATSPIEQVAVTALCARADDVVRLVAGKAKRGVGTPRLLLGCGEAARKAGDNRTALAFFTRVRTDFPSSVQATQAAISAGRLSSGDKKGRTVLVVGAPAGSNDPAPSGRARLVVRNGAPTGLLVSLGGTGSARRSSAACPGCAVGAAGTDARCPQDGPSVTLDVDPGRYTARIRATDGSKAATTTVTLAAGRTVEVCVVATRT